MQDTTGRFKFIELARTELAKLETPALRAAFVIATMEALEHAHGVRIAADTIRQIVEGLPEGEWGQDTTLTRDECVRATLALLRVGVQIVGEGAVIVPDWARETGGSA